MSTSSLSIAVSGLRAHSHAIDATAHNIANVATEGYRRVRVDLTSGHPRVTALGPMGSGVEIEGLSRATDRLADERVRRSSAQSSFFTARSQVSQLAEDVFGEPDRGVTTSINRLFDAYSTLATAPTDSAARAQVIGSLGDVAGRINEVRAGLEGIQTDAVARLRTEVEAGNQLAERVAEINTFARQPGGLPADLADELDRALDSLSERFGARSYVQPDGRVRVTIEGRAIVDADRAVALQVPDSPLGQVDHPTGPITLGGTAGGLQEVIQNDIGGYRTRLDAFVTDMIDTMNTLHGTGFTPDGVAGGDLFEQVDGRVNVLVTTTDELAASDSATGPLGGAVADALAQLRGTVGGDYREVITSVSNSVASLGRSAETATSVASAAQSVRDSITGVNLDEEMTNMIAQQRAYEASARVITIVDEMLQTLLSM